MLSIKKLSRLLFFSITIASNLPAQFSFPGADSIRHGSEQDHQKMMELLNITALPLG